MGSSYGGNAVGAVDYLSSRRCSATIRDPASFLMRKVAVVSFTGATCLHVGLPLHQELILPIRPRVRQMSARQAVPSLKQAVHRSRPESRRTSSGQGTSPTSADSGTMLLHRVNEDIAMPEYGAARLRLGPARGAVVGTGTWLGLLFREQLAVSIDCICSFWAGGERGLPRVLSFAGPVWIATQPRRGVEVAPGISHGCLGCDR